MISLLILLYLEMVLLKAIIFGISAIYTWSSLFRWHKTHRCALTARRNTSLQIRFSFHPFIIHYPAFDGVVLGNLVYPFTELYSTLGIDLEAYGNDHLKTIALGVSIRNLDLLTIGIVNNMYAESSNDEYKGYAQIATQMDFDAF